MVLSSDYRKLPPTAWSRYAANPFHGRLGLPHVFLSVILFGREPEAPGLPRRARACCSARAFHFSFLGIRGKTTETGRIAFPPSRVVKKRFPQLSSLSGLLWQKPL